jgi:hypothetical protein
MAALPAACCLRLHFAQEMEASVLFVTFEQRRMILEIVWKETVVQ